MGHLSALEKQSLTGSGGNLLAVKDNDEPKNINILAKKVPKFLTGKGLREKVK